MLTRLFGGLHASGIAGTSTRTIALTQSSGKLRCTSEPRRMWQAVPKEFPARREVFVARSRAEALRLCAPT